MVRCLPGFSIHGLFPQHGGVKHLLQAFKKNQQQRMQPVKCTRCGQKREATEYDTPTLKNLQHEDRLHEAVCLHCAPQHLPKGWEEMKNTCCVCLEQLPFLAFSVAMQRKIMHRDYRVVRCLECQYPRCSSCGLQAQTLPPGNRMPKCKNDRDKYLCVACEYPNCSGCGKAMEAWRRRPSKKTKNVMIGNTWVCPDCRKFEV